ncbi:MAG: carboxypeptidase regulatory-like domain-containing protein, partial [Algicola sp.]|nr:carboxypeptidase regulatory-like domain-containing protein [Algicola sp.]
MKTHKIKLALTSLIIASSAQAAAFDLSGQVTTNNGSSIAGVKVSLSIPSATGQIVGRLTNTANNNGISGAQVFIDTKPGIGERSPAIAVTDSNGYYTLPDLEEGSYTIAMWKRGYETQYHMNVPVVPGQDATQNITADAVTVSEDKIVLLRADFDEVKFHPDHDGAWAEQMFFDDTPGAASIRNFYYQLSHGRMDLQKGANVLIHVTDPDLQYPHEDSDRDDVVDWVIAASTSKVNYNDSTLDRSSSWDHDPGADDRIDNIVVMTAGLPKSITGSDCDMNPVSMLNSEYVTSNIRSTVQALLPEYSPLGNMAHEVFHSMGETAVQDLYIGGTCDVNDELATPLGTVGKWGTMGIGMYNKLDSFMTDPRGSNCSAGYVDVCEGKDGNCIAKLFGEQPALPTVWTMWKWYHKYFWNQGMVDVDSVPSGQTETIRLYPYSASNGKQVITVAKAGTSQWWSITNRQPIGFDKGLEHSISGEGQTGIVIDFNDPSLAGRMAL